MPGRCPKNPNGESHYWIIDSRTGAAQCKYCETRQQYDIDALIFPDHKERPRQMSSSGQVVASSITLQFTIDVGMVEDLKTLKNKLEEQYSTVSHQAEVYKGIGAKQTDRGIRKSAIDMAERMQRDAGTLTRQVKAISCILGEKVR